MRPTHSYAMYVGKAHSHLHYECEHSKLSNECKTHNYATRETHLQLHYRCEAPSHLH